MKWGQVLTDGCLLFVGRREDKVQEEEEKKKRELFSRPFLVVYIHACAYCLWFSCGSAG